MLSNFDVVLVFFGKDLMHSNFDKVLGWCDKCSKD